MNLPNWPPERLAREAAWAWNLRHPNAVLSMTSPWPALCAAVHCFLRHQHSGYDQMLDALAGYDEEIRDELAEKIYQLARRQYPWLRSERDPRPFTKADRSELLFDQRSWDLSHIHTRITHLESAIRDLAHQPQYRAHVAQLRAELSEHREIAREEFKSITRTVSSDHSRAITSVRDQRRLYYYGGRALPESYTCYAGFRCLECGVAVMRSKRPVPIGGGRRWLAFSCHCQTYLLEPAPYGYQFDPVTPEFWAQLRQNADEQNEAN